MVKRGGDEETYLLYLYDSEREEARAHVRVMGRGRLLGVGNSQFPAPGYSWPSRGRRCRRETRGAFAFYLFSSCTVFTTMLSDVSVNIKRIMARFDKKLAVLLGVCEKDGNPQSTETSVLAI